jgi:phage minor structural protein
MIPILYEKYDTAFLANGLGRLRDCITATVSEGRNDIYELDFTYPVTGAHFNEIQPGRIVAVTHDDTGDVQPFDIVSYSKPIDGVVTFHCVHISYRLTTQVVWATNITSLASALSLFGNVSGTLFSYSSDFSSSAYMAAADGVPRTVRQMLGGIEGSVLDTYGGELLFDKWTVKVCKARGEARDLTIRYGVNMVSYQEDTDYLGTYSACVPYWTGTDTNGGQIVVRGSRVDSGLPTASGRNDVVPLDLTDKFQDKPTAAQLEALALTYMTGKQVNLPAQTIAVEFFRLQDTPEYEDLAPLMNCNLCDTVRVVFPEYNMDGRFKIVKTVYNVLADKYDSMELGTLSTTLAEALGITQTPEKYGAIGDWAVGGDLTVAGDASVAGSLTLGGHSGPIGELKGDTTGKTLTSVTATTSWQQVSSMSLTAGRWVCKGWASFNGSTAGTRYIYITSSASPSDSTVAAVGNFSQYMAASAHGLVAGTTILDVSTTTPFYLYVKTTAGSPPVAYCQLEAIRIR